MSLQGILPISPSKSVFVVDSKSILVEWGFGWGLPAQGEAHEGCGDWKTKGCLNVAEHESGLAFIRRYWKSCHRPECPTCYESWAGREAKRIEHRLKAWKSRGEVIHLVVSPPIEVWIRSSFEALRRRAYEVALDSRFLGGSCIFHPYRKNKATHVWYFSPHFHMLGYGWIKGTKEGYECHGWVVKNAGVRKTVSGTALYQMSHSGVHKSKYTVTWFGHLAYNNFKVPPMEKDDRCPECGNKLRPVNYVGSDVPPMEKGDYWLPLDNWEYPPPPPRISNELLYWVLKKGSKPRVEHTFEALCEANPLMPEWMVRGSLHGYFIGEG
jgi:hypothetical protein